MQRLRSRRWTRLCVLVLHLLVMGVASASPWLRADDGALGVLCSGRGAARPADAGDAPRGLDCPLCLPLQAPGFHVPRLIAMSPADVAPVSAAPHAGTSQRTALPPARGPPHD